MTDEKLMRQYVADGSEDAFRRIVERYLRMVYATCHREVQNSELAQDVTQTVFVLLAQKAQRLRPGTILSGWLFTTARFTCKEALRQESRRRRYELQAVTQMPTYEGQQEQAGTAMMIEPWLNDALSALKPGDREALLLRYADEHSLREIGERYGITEFAAHRRVTRALEKLRRSLTKRGIDAPDTAALTITLPILLAGSVLIVPSSLSAAAIVHAVPNVLTGIAGTTITGARLFQLTQGVNHTMRILQLKTAAVVLAGGLAVGVGTIKLAHSGAPVTKKSGIARATVLAVPTVQSDTTRYTVADLGTLPGFKYCEPTSINNKGEIVGMTQTGDTRTPGHVFYYHDGALRDLASPAGYLLGSPVINDQGTIIGHANKLTGQGKALIGTKDKLSIYIPPPPYRSLRHMTFDAINNKGVILGRYSGHGLNGAFLLSAGEIHQVMGLGIYNGSFSINDRNQIISVTTPGRKGFLYSDGQVTMLPSLPSCLTIPTAINSHGDIAGSLRNRRTAGDTAFLVHNGVLTDLGTAPGFTNSTGVAINDAAVVAGTVSNNTIAHAAVFRNGLAADLNTLIDSAPGWNLMEAIGINNSGQIIGKGLHNGTYTAFLLTPKR